MDEVDIAAKRNVTVARALKRVTGESEIDKVEGCKYTSNGEKQYGELFEVAVGRIGWGEMLGVPEVPKVRRLSFTVTILKMPPLN